MSLSYLQRMLIDLAKKETGLTDEVAAVDAFIVILSGGFDHDPNSHEVNASSLFSATIQELKATRKQLNQEGKQ